MIWQIHILVDSNGTNLQVRLYFSIFTCLVILPVVFLFHCTVGGVVQSTIKALSREPCDKIHVSDHTSIHSQPDWVQFCPWCSGSWMQLTNCINILKVLEHWLWTSQSTFTKWTLHKARQLKIQRKIYFKYHKKIGESPETHCWIPPQEGNRKDGKTF